MSETKVDTVMFNISDHIKCELCDNMFEVSVKYLPFQTIKLCNVCMEKVHDHLFDFIYQYDGKQFKHITCNRNIKGKHFETGKDLTWGQLKEFLNTVTDEDVLNSPVLCQEHHHYELIRCNPTIEVRLNEEVAMVFEDERIRRPDELEDLRHQFERFLSPDNSGDNSAYTLQHPKQFNLSLTI